MSKVVKNMSGYDPEYDSLDVVQTFTRLASKYNFKPIDNILKLERSILGFNTSCQLFERNPNTELPQRFFLIFNLVRDYVINYIQINQKKCDKVCTDIQCEYMDDVTTIENAIKIMNYIVERLLENSIESYIREYNTLFEERVYILIRIMNKKIDDMIDNTETHETESSNTQVIES